MVCPINPLIDDTLNPNIFSLREEIEQIRRENKELRDEIVYNSKQLYIIIWKNLSYDLVLQFSFSFAV